MELDWIQIFEESPIVSDLGRMLATQQVQTSFTNNGDVVGAIIGIIYVFAFNYYLSIKFFNHIIEDLVYLVNYKEDEDKEMYRPIVYCLLNSIPVLVYNISCVIESNSDSGLMLVFSTDVVDVCLIFSLLLILEILPKKKEGSEVDGWLLLRDTLWYSVGVGIFAVFLYFNLVAWWSGLLMILYWIIYLIILSYNESIRNEIYLLVGLKHEDDSFNADEQMRQRKRRISITELSYKNLIDKEDEQLKKKIMRMDALLRVKFAEELRKKEVFSKWQVAVYTVMFGIRNKHKEEKIQRSANYAKLFAPNNKDASMPSDNNSVDQDVDQKEDDELIQKKDQGEEKNKKKQLQINSNGDEDPQKNNNGDDIEKNLQPITNKNNFNNENDQFDQQDRQDNQSEKDVKPQSINDEPVNLNEGLDENNENADENQDKFQVGLAFPNKLIDQILYILFFPIHLIIYLLPNYHINPSHRKLAASFFINVVIISGLMVLLQYLFDNLNGYMNGHNAAYSLAITSVFLQLPFFQYNYQFVKKEKDPIDFMLTFLQLGIFKTGAIIGISVIISSIVSLQSSTDILFSDYFYIVMIIIVAIVMINAIIIRFTSLKANGLVSKYLILAYIMFLISGIILLSF